MIKKNVKQPLLNQDVPYPSQGQWIYMEDIKYNEKKYQNKEKDYKYNKLRQQSEQHHMMIKKEKNYPEVPKESQEYNPNFIKINGQVFKKVQSNVGKPKKKSKIPHMHVSCRHCDTIQSVEGTSNEYWCGKCQKLNSCTPAYRIFLCCKCSSKVLYEAGVSNIIRCTKCGMVNSLPEIHNHNPYQIIEQPYQGDQNDKHTQLYDCEVISDLRSDISLEDQYNTFPKRQNHLRYPQL